MSKRLMTDRDHLVALLASIENLSKDAEITSTDSLDRLLASAARASQDVYPQR